MKERISCTVAAILFTILTVNGQGTEDEKTRIRKVNLASFEKIIVNTDINVLLLQDGNLHTAFIEGDQKLTAGVELSMAGKALVINSRYQKTSYIDKVIITIPISRLEGIQVNGHSTIASLNNIIITGQPIEH